MDEVFNWTDEEDNTDQDSENIGIKKYQNWQIDKKKKLDNAWEQIDYIT